MKSKIKILLYALFISGICHPVYAQNYLGKQREINRILENIKSFSSHVMASDYDKIAASYTSDGKIFPNSREIISGIDPIKAYWQLPEGVSITHHKVMPEEIRVKGKEAYDYGYYEGTTKTATGEEVSWKGKYVIIWRKVDKEWKIYLDIWNSVQS